MTATPPPKDPYRLEFDAFARFIEGQPIPPRSLAVLGLKSVFALFEAMIRYIPGGFGYKLRYWFYRPFLREIGKNVLIDTGVFLNGLRNISLGDYVWIDANCRIDAMLGEVRIGRRVHMAPNGIIGTREPVIIEDYVGLSAGVKIYSNSEHPIAGKRMSGPMVPERYKAFHSKQITLHKDSFVGANSVLLPGAELGEGAIVGANCVISKVIEPWTIVVGIPPHVVGRRDQVTVPDL